MPPARKKRKHKVDAEEAQDDGAVQVDEGENDEPQEGETQEGVKKGTNHPAFAKKGWKSVQLDLDMMKEFENDGGLFFEEADPAEIGVMYLDKENLGLGPSLLCTKKVKKAKTKGKKRALGGDGAKEDLATENDRLKKELDKLKGQTQAQEEERAVVELKAWAQFDLHPKILAGLARLGFKTPTSVQARCLGPACRQRKDVVGAAQTGSGKTLAFGLPILHHTLLWLDQLAATGGGGSSSSTGEKVGEKGADSRDLAGGLKALIVLPTRELAVQVQAHINAVAAGTPVYAECVVGGMSSQKQKRLLRRHPAIVVGTPGRIFALLGFGEEEDRCDWLKASLKGLRHLVLDEADRLIEGGHFKDLTKTLELVYSSVERKQQLQTFVFSATLTLDPRLQRQGGRTDWDSDSGKVAALMQRIQFREPRAVFTVDLTRPEQAEGEQQDAELPKINNRLPEQLQFKELQASDDKDREAMLAVWLLRRFRWGVPSKAKFGGLAAAVAAAGADDVKPIGGRVIIFVNAVTSVMRLESVLSLLLESPSANKVLNKVKMSNHHNGNGKGDAEAPAMMVDVLGLHSKMKQKDRLKRMERFRTLKDAVLLSTDVAARGLDVKDVSAVLHYHAPRGSEVFVHRSGRTARAGKQGDSVACIGPGDASHWKQVYKTVGISKERVEEIDIAAEEVSAAKEASKLASDLEKKVHQTSKKASEKNWFKKAAEEAELMMDSDEEDREMGKAAAPHHALWGLYRQLQARTRRPPRRQGAAPIKRKDRLQVARRGIR